jgi:hypothetical protein
VLAVNFEKKEVRELAEGEQPGENEVAVHFDPFNVAEGCWRCDYFVQSLVYDIKVEKYKLTCKACPFNAAKAWEIQ